MGARTENYGISPDVRGDLLRTFDIIIFVGASLSSQFSAEFKFI